MIVATVLTPGGSVGLSRRDRRGVPGEMIPAIIHSSPPGHGVLSPGNLVGHPRGFSGDSATPTVRDVFPLIIEDFLGGKRRDITGAIAGETSGE